MHFAKQNETAAQLIARYGPKRTGPYVKLRPHGDLIQDLKDRQISHAAFDSDDENSTLKRFHSEVGFINANHPPDIDRMVDALLESDVVVVDCRAASTGIFLNYFDETEMPTVLEGLDAGL